MKANVLVAGADYFTRAFPEVDQMNYVPRVTTPTLLINGDTDFYCPVETCAKPFHRLLGTPEPHKRLVVTQSGHFPPRNDMVRETLDWFDRPRARSVTTRCAQRVLDPVMYQVPPTRTTSA